MENERASLSKLTGIIYRCTQAYANEALKKYGLGSGTYPFLLSLYLRDGVNQNQISRDLGLDKAMSARSLKKLVALGYVEKTADTCDCRAFKLYLTPKARAVVPEIKAELHKWNGMITQSLDERQIEQVAELLDIISRDAKRFSSKQGV